MDARMRRSVFAILSALTLVLGLVWALNAHPSTAMAQNQVVVATPGDDPEQAELCLNTLDLAQIEACRADGYLTQEPDPRAARFQGMGLRATAATAQTLAPLARSRFVATTGVDCGNCTDSVHPCRTIQYAINQAANGDHVFVAAGEYTNLVYHREMTQTFYVDNKSLTISGGYDPLSWQPTTIRTILNPHGFGRGATVSGTVTVSLDNLTVINGNGYAMPEPPSGEDGPNWWSQIGGGLLAIQGAQVYVYNSEFAYGDGDIAGGLALEHSTVQLVDSYIHDNQQYGVDIYDEPASVIANTTIERNDNGIFLFFASGTTITNTRFLSNEGTALRLYGLGGTTISSSTFASNNAGVVGAWASGTVVEDSEITGNGTGLDCSFCYGSKVERTVISDNALMGVRDAFSGFTLENSLFLNNPVRAIESWANSVIQHSNIVSNGVGLYAADGTVRVVNSIVAGNLTAFATQAHPTHPGLVIADTNVTWQNQVLAQGGLISPTNSLAADPLLNMDSIHIHPCSPARDSGMILGVTNDYDNEPRPEGSAPDIGMHETSEECLFEAPVANNDNYTTTRNTPLVIAAPGVLGNDSDADGDTLTARKVTNPIGTLTLHTDGSFVYTPTLDFTGVVTFVYRAYDGLLTSSPAMVTIAVKYVSYLPVIVTR